MKLPDKIFGVDTGEAYRKFLEGTLKPKKESSLRNPLPSQNDVDLSKYVLMPQHGLYVAKHLSHHGKNWYDAHISLQQDGARMLTIREYIDFLTLLKSDRIIVDLFNGLEQRITAEERERIYKNITEKKDPWRSEWLDADFKVVNETLHINYGHHMVNGSLQPTASEPLEKCLMEDGYIDLFSANRHGLPTRKNKKQEFYYFKPLTDNNSVAGFGANSDWAYLNCYGNPQVSNPALGVRAARAKK